MSNDSTQLVTGILVDGFSRIDDGVAAVLNGLSIEQILWRPDPDGNPIGWLLWHLTRQQDAQLSRIGGTDPVWTAEGWYDRFSLPYEQSAHGYGQSSDEVGAFTIDDPQLLTGYQSATYAMTKQLLGRLSRADFEQVIDRNYDPPVTAAVRIVSVLDDAAKHLGQAEYLKGMVQRTS